MSTIGTSFEGWSFDESDVAAKSSTPPIIYIDSKLGSDAGKKIEHALHGLRLSFERIEATDGIHLPAHLRWQFFTDGCLHPTLTPIEVGRYASHLLAMEAITENGWQSAVILEDEAIVSPDLNEEISEIVASLPWNWDVVHLCQDPWGATKTVAETDIGITVIQYSRHPGGTTGYLVSREGAKKFTSARKRHFAIEADLRQPWIFGLHIYGLSRRVVFNPNRPDYPMVEMSALSPLQQGSAGRLSENLLRWFRREIEA